MNTQKIKHLFKTLGLLLATGVIVVSFQNCAAWLGSSAHSGDTGAASTAQSFAVVPFSKAQPILIQHCSPCHSPASGNAQAIAKISDMSNQSIVEGSAFVKMGTPQTSTLYLDIVDGVMPQTGTALSANEIETIREWILAANINTDVLAGTLPVITGGGTGGGGGTGTGSVSFSKQIAPLIQGQCAGCHGANSPSLGSYAQISAVGSQIVSVITSTNPAVLMPPGAPLSASQITMIESWVNSGAPNN